MPPKKKTSGNEENGAGKKSRLTGGQFQLRSDLKSQEVVSCLNQAWRAKAGDKTFLDGDVEVASIPFSSCVAKNFIQQEPEEDISLTELVTDLNSLELTHKNNDLYKFHQSNDLCNIDIPSIAAFKQFLLTQVKPWLSAVTGIADLSDVIDIFCAKYGHTDHLLCHDDKLEGRRIAYILYLVPEDWSSSDGGCLDLFSSENGEPAQVVKSILPARNSFAFFEVSPISYHQVAEVLSEDKVRLSLTGWFHGPAPPKRESYSTPRLMAPKDITEQEFFSWINPIYLNPVTQSEINEKFEHSSEISLPDFLTKEKYREICQALESINQEWVRVGPPNKRCYDVLPLPDIPSFQIANPAVEAVRHCVDFLRSDAFCLVVSNMTGLRLHQLAENNDDDEVEHDDVGSDDGGRSSDGDDMDHSGLTSDVSGSDKMESVTPSKSKARGKKKADKENRPEASVANNGPSSAADSSKSPFSATATPTTTTPNVVVNDAGSGDGRSMTDDDAWSTVSTLGESECRFVTRSDRDFPDSTSSSGAPPLSREALKKSERKLAEDVKNVSLAGSSSLSAMANDDNWSIAATVGENAEPVALVRAEVRRWRPGCYSLLFDDDGSEDKRSALDARLCFNCANDWNLDWGGFSSYLAKNEDEELLTVPPIPNNLSLVYREADTLGFIKYVNSDVCNDFHDLALTFVEQIPDD